MGNKEKMSLLYKVAILRKINAVVSLICILLILIHGSYDALWMFLRGKIDTISFPLPWILMGVVIIHAVLSILTAILATRGNKKEGKMYKKDNIKTLLQRMLGMIMIVVLVFHIVGMGNHLNPKIFHSIIHPIFFMVVYVHSAISFSKAFITLGIGNIKFIKIVDIVSYIIFGVLFICSLIGLFFVMYGRWLG